MRILHIMATFCTEFIRTNVPLSTSMSNNATIYTFNEFNTTDYPIKSSYITYLDVPYHELNIEPMPVDNPTIELQFRGDGRIIHQGGNFYPIYDADTAQFFVSVITHNHTKYILISNRCGSRQHFFIKSEQLTHLNYNYDKYKKSPVGGCGSIHIRHREIDEDEFEQVTDDHFTVTEVCM